MRTCRWKFGCKADPSMDYFVLVSRSGGHTTYMYAIPFLIKAMSTFLFGFCECASCPAILFRSLYCWFHWFHFGSWFYNVTSYISDTIEAKSGSEKFTAFNVNIFMQGKYADTEDMSITLKPQSNAFMCNVSLMPFYSPLFLSVEWKI